MSTISEEVKKYMSKLGKKGTGKSKVRGDSEYYKNLVRIREEKKRQSGTCKSSRV